MAAVARRIPMVVVMLTAALLTGTASAAAPGNDNFADAQTISGLTGAVGGTNVDATAEAGEPDHADELAVASVWYRWTAPSDGPITFDLCGAGFDSILAVYTGSTLATLTEVGANDDSFDDWCGFRSSRLTIPAAAGIEYRIAVDGYLGQTGSFALHWTPPRAANTGRPAISGRAAEGDTLSVSAGQWQSVLPTTHGYQWQRCGRLDYPASNVALGRSVTASASQVDHPAAHGVDGSLATYWSAGDSPPQRIEVDLGAPYPVNRIRTAIALASAGFTTHRILAKGPQPNDPYVVLAEPSGDLSDGQVLEWAPAGGWISGVQFIRVETGTSPSWVAWREIETYANCTNLQGATGSSYTVSRGDVGFMLRAVVTATSASGSTAAASLFSDVVPYVTPENVARPTIVGPAKVRGVLRATVGEWRGTQPLSFALRWERCASRAAPACTTIPGATGAQFTVGSREVGSSIRIVVTAANDAGSSSTASDATTAIPALCSVPRLKGQTLKRAQRALSRAHCRLGKITRKYSRRVKKGRVIAQRPSPGIERPTGTKVSVVVSRGRRR